MFTLKPLISGTTTLTQMLTDQLHEFETISGLPTHLEVVGEAEEEDRRRGGDRRQMAQVGTAIFRITQEALTNAYKHAQASWLEVHLRYLPDRIEVEIRDDGRGLGASADAFTGGANGERRPIFSGHGLGGMRARAEELGGSFEVEQLGSGGVRVHACLPSKAKDVGYVKNTPDDRR
jgi:signal transduction histidine kinase